MGAVAMVPPADLLAEEPRGDYLYFAYWQVDGIDRWYEDLCAKQVSIVKPLRTEPWGRG